MRCLPGQNARTLVQQLTQARDRKIFRSLATSNDLSKTRDVRRAARDDAIKRIAASGKRDCASYVSKLLKKTGDAVLDAQSFSAILERASRSDADKIVLRGAP